MDKFYFYKYGYSAATMSRFRRKNKLKQIQQQVTDDECDCQFVGCAGCWYPCETCGSTKCSPFCRVGRKHSLVWTRSD